MRYFTRFLPVEGEIKDTDLSFTEEHGVDVHSNWLPEFKEIAKKVKLFLCSRDIQVGDKVQHISGVEVEAYKINPQGKGNRTELLVKDGIHILSMWLDEFFKVIGEISPDATRVKEGDEFAEDEIDICWVSYDVEGKGSFSLVVLTVR